MSAGVPPSVSPLPTGLHARRCARHSDREAAARCPGCHEFFCRECVVEHDGKLLCAACLARVVAQAEVRRRLWAKAQRAAGAMAGAVLLWISFQAIGAVLLKIPPAFHDGTIWKKLGEGEK